jgi:hypothetical protein
MKLCDVNLFFENVDPDIDVDLIHKTFVDNDMDAIIALGNIYEGKLGINVSCYSDNIDESAMKAIHIAEEIIGEGKLSKVTSGLS